MMMTRLMAFDLVPSIPVVVTLLASVAIGVSLPSAPGYVGVYHAFAAGALMVFGIDEEVAVGFAIFSHAVDIIPSIVMGLIAMVLEGLGCPLQHTALFRSFGAFRPGRLSFLRLYPACPGLHRSHC